MIIGVLGKGGSGKTTTATALVRYLAEREQPTLAIDNDHNQDLAFNLGVSDAGGTYFGSSLPDLLIYAGYQPTANYRDALSTHERFKIFPHDAVTAKYAHQPSAHLSVLVSGPHTSNILHDEACSHSLTTPLKVYLPLLTTGDATVIVDEKAGLDGVGTGVTTGFTAAIVVAEPTPHSIKVAAGIVELLEFYGTPYGIVATKTHDDALVRAAFPLHTITALSSDMAQDEHDVALSKIIAFGRSVSHSGDTRLTRTIDKIERNKSYQTTG